MNIQEMIDSIVARKVEDAIAKMFDGTTDKGVRSVVSDYSEKGENARSLAARRTYLLESGQSDRSMAKAAVASYRRKTRTRRPRVGYVIVPRRGRFTMPELFATAETTFKAILKARQPISAPDLERVTGLGKKTIESCVWYLRRHDATGAVVKDGRGLVTAALLD